MRIKPKKQIYSNYTAEDFKVWNILYTRQMEYLRGRVSEEFLEALDTVGFNADEIPNFKKVNEVLAQTTGWKLHTVENLAPAREFFQHLSRKEFTATCWLRSMEELDYLEEPDMFHDVFAHTPLLSNEDYTDFFHKFGQLALRCVEHEDIITKLQRLYWFTIEFGLIRNDDGLKIYGAGIISSKDETLHSLSERSIKFDYDIDEIFEHDFRIDTIQESYYVIDSFKQLTDSLSEVEEKVEAMLGEPLLAD
ncbi:MAG TPA: phenylalanine 4-monooxygenase [Saprospiraceae bacterium]|nr:phenylalanine 4-monooxygenase [Saprospiraceae bacterium]